MEVIEAPASVEQPFKQPICSHLFTSECDVPVPGIFHFFGGIGKKWYRKKVSEPVSEKFGTGKSPGTGIGKIWYRKKVSEPVSEKLGTGADFCRQIF